MASGSSCRLVSFSIKIPRSTRSNAFEKSTIKQRTWILYSIILWQPNAWSLPMHKQCYRLDEKQTGQRLNPTKLLVVCSHRVKTHFSTTRERIGITTGYKSEKWRQYGGVLGAGVITADTEEHQNAKSNRLWMQRIWRAETNKIRKLNKVYYHNRETFWRPSAEHSFRFVRIQRLNGGNSGERTERRSATAASSFIWRTLQSHLQSHSLLSGRSKSLPYISLWSAHQWAEKDECARY